MNFWQFKFDMKKGNWKEFETISRGEHFNQSITAHKKMQNCKGDIVFYYRMDRKGIYFIAEIISDPYISEYNTKYAIDLRIIKRLEEPFNDYSNDIYAQLQNKLDPMGQGASKYLLKEEDKGSELYIYLMNKTDALNSLDIKIEQSDYKEAEQIKQKYIDNGYLFNAFHNLNLIRGEVKHLAFIGNLLNPYGNHFQDDLFLRYFMQSLRGYPDLEDNEVAKNFINDNPSVVVEKSIYDENGNNIGRVDLWLESDNYIIAIEGKIEAKDNKGQLVKYDEYLKGQDKKYLLIYLTLNRGTEPEKVDISKLSNFHLMNFEEDILEFIDASINDAGVINYVQSTLFDYKDALLKYMYKFHLSFEYSLELIQEMTKNKKTFKNYQKITEYYWQNKEKEKNRVVEDIAENLEYAKAYIERLFFAEILKYAKDNLQELDFDMDNSTLNLADDNISIASDISAIAKARINRLTSYGHVSICLKDVVNENDDFVFEIINNYFGVSLNTITDGCIADKAVDHIYFKVFGKLSSDIFKSANIANLLDEKYMKNQIDIIFAKSINLNT